MSRNANPALSAWCLFALSLTFTRIAVAQETPRGERAPWTTSRFSGTPDPAPPYKVEPAFPNLNFDRPLLLDHVPGTDRLVVGQAPGQVVTFPNDPTAKSTDVAIDLRAVRPGMSALYGLAFHPKFETTRFVYLCYVMRNDTPDGTRVSRFTATSVTPLKLDSSSEEVVLTYPSGGHNGGCLAFGNDGFLYISTGDAEVPTPPDPRRTGQDISDLLASILRIDVDHRDAGKSYRIPPDNPFVKTLGARPEIWAYGLRNPWRMSFDRKKGDLWVGDVGWELWEMIHLVRKGSNCGWSLVEGSQPVLTELKPGPTPIVPPVIAHPHSEAASITGGYVYRGKKFSSLENVYIYGDYQSGKVWGLRYDGDKVTWRGELADSGLRLVAFGEDRESEIYLIEYERTNAIYRLVPDPAANAKSMFPRRLSETGLFASTRELTPSPGVLPYRINAEMWSDGARAERLLAIPGKARGDVDREGRIQVPDGTVLARTVTLDLVEGVPKSRRRLETQVLHKETGSWRPYTYRWNDDQNDADLIDAGGAVLDFKVEDSGAPGGKREHHYRFAARSECVLCHNPWVSTSNTLFGRQTASPLALTTAELNVGDQLARIEPYLRSGSASLGRALANPYDNRANLDDRARAYLQVNCAHCHQIGAGGSANLVLTERTPLAETRAINAAPAQGRFGLPDARIIAPGHPERSVLYYRIAKMGAGRMPRIGSDRVDPSGSKLIADWIAAMPTSDSHRPSSDLEMVGNAAVSEQSQREAVRRLLKSTEGAIDLLRAVDSERISPHARAEIVSTAKSAPAEVRDLFERFLPESERAKRLGDGFDRPALLAQPGDVERGRAQFRAGGGTSCASCHKAEGFGTEVGPALDGIGSKYGRAELLEQIVDPSKSIDLKYATHVIATRAGQVHTGLLVEETAKELILRNAYQPAIRVEIAEIEERAKPNRSLMPDGLMRDLTSRQAADLIAYLTSLKKP